MQSKYEVIKESSDYPLNWDKGFSGEIRIGSNGQEVPFKHTGKWYIYIWNTEEKKHGFYCYDDDMIYPDDHFSQ